MARRTSPPAKQPALLSVRDMQSALRKLQRRLNEVEAIDPKQATDAYTPEFASINENVNMTLIDIFGSDSIEYDKFKSISIYAGPYKYRQEMPRHEIIEGYAEGKKRVLIKIDAAIKFINEKLSDVAESDSFDDLQSRRKSRVIGNTIFIGHGRSPIWRELKDFLQKRLHLSVDEFNSVAVAGVPTVTRLEEMLDAAASS